LTKPVAVNTGLALPRSLWQRHTQQTNCYTWLLKWWSEMK